MRELTFHHIVMSLTNFIELSNLPKTRVNPPGTYEVVVRPGLLCVRAMRALQALLPNPVVTQINDRRVPRRTCANHNHATDIAAEDRGGYRVFSRMFQDNARISSFS